MTLTIHPPSWLKVPLPPEALQSHLAIVGKTGSGKTYAAKHLVEYLLTLGRRVVILDPTGAWWGLKSSANGEEAAFPVAVFGGDHADIPLDEKAGTAIGELLGTEATSAIIDLSNTTLGQRQRFVERFAEEIYRVNRSPLHLVIDEADEFAPQNPGPDAARMLGAIDRIVRRGRSRGFRVAMITQRPAVLNKNVLTQANTLIAMRLPAAQDRKAIQEWIKGQADEDQAKELLGSLAGLKRGEGWIWSPEQGVLERTQFPKITTFDSSRTPDDGEVLSSPKSLAEIDLSRVQAALDAAVAEVKANDPATLKARIKDLEEQLASKAPAKPDPDPELVRRLANQKVAIGDALQELGEIAKSIDGIMVRNQRALAALSGEAYAAAQSQDGVDGEAVRGSDAAASGGGRCDAGDLAARVAGDDGAEGDRGRRPAGDGGAPRRSGGSVGRGGAGGGLGDDPVGHGVAAGAGGRAGSERLATPLAKIVNALAWWAAAGINTPTKAQVAAVAGYSPGGGTFNRYLSSLSSGGFIFYPSQGHIQATALGMAAADLVEKAPGMRELHRRVLAILETSPRRILEHLLSHGTRPVDRIKLGSITGFDAKKSGTFNRYLSTLSGLEFITYPRRGEVAAAAWLFPGGLK